MMLILTVVPSITDACSGTYYYCDCCEGFTQTKESLLAEAALNCPEGSSYTLHDLDTGKESKVWVVG